MTRPRTIRRLAIGGALVLSAFGAAIATTAPPAAAVVGVNRLAFEGEVGDKIIGSRFAEAADPAQIKSLGGRLETGIEEFQYIAGTQNFEVLFQADRDGDNVIAGLHEQAVRAEANHAVHMPQGVPGLHFFGLGVACFKVKGRYIVDQITRDGAGAVTSFAARFEQHCEGVDAASFGTVAFNATVPLYVHQLSALALTFPSTASGGTSASQPVTITNRSSVALPVSAITLTGLNANQFTIVTDPCSGTSIPAAGTCTVTVALKPTAVNANVTAKLTIADSFTAWGTAPVGEDVRLTGAATAADGGTGGGTGGGDPGSLGGGGLGGGGGVVVTNPPSGGEFHALQPARLLDTRDGTGQGNVPHTLGDAETITVPVAGHGGVPATGATAVAVNLTATGPKQPGWLSLFPSGTTWPGSSTVNFPTDGTAPNMAIMALGSDGNLSLRNCCGSADAIVDVVGWYGSPSDPPAAGYNPLTPQRLLDTRDANQPIGSDTSRRVQVRGLLGVPADATSVVMNVTATAPTATTYVTVYPSDVVLPKASSLNVVIGETRPNLVSVKLGADGAVNVYNHAGSTQIVLDVVGYYGPSRGASGRVAATAPARLLDTRNVTGGALGAGATKTVDFRGDDGQVHVAAAIINVTVTEPTAASYVTVFPNGPSVPGVSNLNFVAGQTIANLVMVPVGADGKVAFFNHLGSVQLVVDLVGVVTI